jgi:hypothetical protein
VILDRLSSLFGPCLGLNVVNICLVIFIAVSVDFSIFTKEGALVEGVFVRQIACLNDLVLLSVEDIRAATRSSIFLPSEYQDLTLRHGTCSEPVLYVCLKTTAPNLD